MLNFSFAELCNSETAEKLRLNNVPLTIEVQDNLLLLMTEVLQPLRSKLGKPIIITSGYRCSYLNTLVGGKDNSQHLKGQAADIKVTGMTAAALFKYIKESNIKYDQLINEYNKWVHISYNKNRNRNQSFVIC